MLAFKENWLNCPSWSNIYLNAQTLQLILSGNKDYKFKQTSQTKHKQNKYTRNISYSEEVNQDISTLHAQKTLVNKISCWSINSYFSTTLSRITKHYSSGKGVAQWKYNNLNLPNIRTHSYGFYWPTKLVFCGKIFSQNIQLIVLIKPQNFYQFHNWH